MTEQVRCKSCGNPFNERPLSVVLHELDTLYAQVTPGEWWQESHKTPTAPSKDARELGSLLCNFPDEDGPRFWNWFGDGDFVAAVKNAWPQIRAALKVADHQSGSASPEAVSKADGPHA
jgi:hypothetical protein